MPRQTIEALRNMKFLDDHRSDRTDYAAESRYAAPLSGCLPLHGPGRFVREEPHHGVWQNPSNPMQPPDSATQSLTVDFCGDVSPEAILLPNILWRRLAANRCTSNAGKQFAGVPKCLMLL